MVTAAMLWFASHGCSHVKWKATREQKHLKCQDLPFQQAWKKSPELGSLIYCKKQMVQKLDRISVQTEIVCCKCQQPFLHQSTCVGSWEVRQWPYFRFPSRAVSFQRNPSFPTKVVSVLFQWLKQKKLWRNTRRKKVFLFIQYQRKFNIYNHIT